MPQLGASLVDAGLFRRLLELEVRKAQRLRYCLCVVRLKGRIPVQFEAPAWLPQILACRIRATDLAMAHGPDDVTFLLIDADISALPGILRRLIADFETVLWRAGAASYPKSASDPDELLEQAEHMLLDVQ